MSTFIFNFKQGFVPSVVSGEKRQTIRATRKDRRRPVVGDTLKLYSGLRTRLAKLLRTEVATEVMAVRIHSDDQLIVVDGSCLTPEEASQFARADGFADRFEMLTWFEDTHGKDFEGFCVRWDPTP